MFDADLYDHIRAPRGKGKKATGLVDDVVQFINAYGLPAFVARTQQLAARHGPRFAPAELLLRMAEQQHFDAD